MGGAEAYGIPKESLKPLALPKDLVALWPAILRFAAAWRP